MTVPFGEQPLSSIQCPHCENVVTTHIRSKLTTTFIIVCVVLFIVVTIAHLAVGVFAFALLLLLLLPTYKIFEHTCPVDGYVIGTYKKKLQLKLF